MAWSVHCPSLKPTSPKPIRTPLRFALNIITIRDMETVGNEKNGIRELELALGVTHMAELLRESVPFKHRWPRSRCFNTGTWQRQWSGHLVLFFCRAAPGPGTLKDKWDRAENQLNVDKIKRIALCGCDIRFHDVGAPGLVVLRITFCSFR